MAQPVAGTSFVTFYSFKGGVGRSMALINTAAILAGQRGFRVLVIDVDLEAPGLSYLNPAEPDRAEGEREQEPMMGEGFIDLLADAKERGQEADLFQLKPAALAERYTRFIEIPEAARKVEGGSLRIMPSGRLDKDYGRLLSLLNVGQLYAEGIGEPLARALKRILANSGLYDYVLIDSRTGLSEEAGMCTRDLADRVMVVSGLNRQNVEGTSSFLRDFREATRGEKAVQFILSPVPNGEDELFERREAAARRAFAEALGREVDVSLQIPYHPQLALTEEPHIFRRQKGYLFQAYQAIERSLLLNLGHTSGAFNAKIVAALNQRQYGPAIYDLRHMVKLEGGRSTLAQMISRVLWAEQNTSSESKGDSVPRLEDLLASEPAVMPIIVDELDVKADSWVIVTLAERLEKSVPQLAETLFRKLVEAYPRDARHLGNYAVFLTNQLEFDRAEELYERSLEADPQQANNLGNFANFLTDQRKNFDRAEEYYERALKADPRHVSNLGNFANFLADQRKNFNRAEEFYVRALEADPRNANILRNAALFFAGQRKDYKRAEEYYERALKVDPRDSSVLNSFANLIAIQHKDYVRAEKYYLLALEANPEHPSVLGNYGQLLLGTGRVKEGAALLATGFEKAPADRRDWLAEFAFSLWLAVRLQGLDGTIWEARYKGLIADGFERSPWSFDLMLEQAAKVLQPDELAYAQALAAAFLDADRVRDLASFSRWNELEAIAPEDGRAPNAHTIDADGKKSGR